MKARNLSKENSREKNKIYNALVNSCRLTLQYLAIVLFNLKVSNAAGDIATNFLILFLQYSKPSLFKNDCTLAA